VRENGYNLNIPRYVESGEVVEQFDIYATMFGGIPNAEIDSLQKYWDAIPSLRDNLFKPQIGKPYSDLKVKDVKAAIEDNVDVQWFSTQFTEAFSGFAETLHEMLIDNVKNVLELQAQDEIAADIFNRLHEIPLVDKYSAYQALANNWQSIISDIETIQEEGISAARVVETAYKIVKNNDEDVEVPDGLKGRIIPFELIQNMKFQKELNSISALQSRVDDIIGELDELRDSLTEDETDTYCDSEKDNALDKKKITFDAKPKTDIDNETKVKLKKIVSLWDEQTKTNKLIKAEKQSLENKSIEAIQNLSDDEISECLHMKWIDPVCSGINSTFSDVLSNLESSVLSISEKYSLSYRQINSEVALANKELIELVEQLTGDEFAIEGLTELIKG
jgi:type I restriction enzyme M protein